MLNDNRKPISPSILTANGIERLHWVFRSIIGFVLVASQNSWLCLDLFGDSLFSICLDSRLRSFPFFFFFFFFFLTTCQHLYTVYRSYKFHFSTTFSLKIDLTILFTPLKIILLQYFQFQQNKFHLNGPLTEYLFKNNLFN